MFSVDIFDIYTVDFYFWIAPLLSYKFIKNFSFYTPFILVENWFNFLNIVLRISQRKIILDLITFFLNLTLCLIPHVIH